MSKRVKQYLMLLAALGVVAVALGGGSGTFASFNAQVSNDNNYFATGTLFLHQQPLTGNLCRSEDQGTLNQNVNVNCDVLFNSNSDTLLKPGDNAYARVEMDNAGSLAASTFTLATSCTSATPSIATVQTFAANDTTITVDGLKQPLVAGTKLIIEDASGNALTSAFTVQNTVTSYTASNQSVDVSALSAGAASGYLHVYESFGAGLCDATKGLQFYVQETDSNWNANGKCVFPSSNTQACSAVGTDTLKDAATAGDLSLGSLAAGAAKYYEIGVKVPAPASTVDNSIQNSEAKFDLNWTLAQ